MKLPSPRGPVSESLFEALRGGKPPIEPAAGCGDLLADEDHQLALYCAYELHYRGFEDVDPDREWDPAVLSWRAPLEVALERAVAEAVPRREGLAPDEVAPLLFELAEREDGPSLSLHLATDGTIEQYREFLIHRSAYQLKEADPHSWAIPRLEGAAKAALVEVQADEYGSGRPERVHATLFANSMRSLGLDPAYGAYLDRIPGFTLATVNLLTLFGLKRRLRGATVGHLAMFEITSPGPNRRYGKGLRRLGVDEAALDFFDEHVEADSIHENIAAYDMAGGLARQEPELAADILFGAEALLEVERRWAAMVLERWQRGQSSLLASREEPKPEARALV